MFSLVTHVKKIADFQTKIFENNELHLSKIAQFNSFGRRVYITSWIVQSNTCRFRKENKSGL